MTNIDDLKSDWKSLEKPESSAGNKTDSSSLIDDFRKIQQRTKKENIIISILFVLTLTFLWVIFYLMDSTSWWVWSGLIIITVEMTGYLVFVWFRNSFKKWGDLKHSSYQYVSEAIKKLQYRTFLMRYIVPVYGLLLITGLNLIYIDVLGDLGTPLRWVIHGSLTVLMTGFFAYTIRRKLKKERVEIMPLIKELQAMKESLE